MPNKVVLHKGEIARIAVSPVVLAAIRPQVDVITEAVRAACPVEPVKSKGGAKSIHAELHFPEWRISWDREHFYLDFVETGSQHQKPQPFARPAVDRLVPERQRHR